MRIGVGCTVGPDKLRIASISAVAVEEKRIIACIIGCSVCKADRYVRQRNDMALVVQTLICLRSGHVDRDPVDQTYGAALLKVLYIDRITFIFRTSSSNIGKLFGDLICAVRTAGSIVKHVIAALERQSGRIDRSDITGVHQSVIVTAAAAAGPGAAAGDAVDRGGLTVRALLIRNVASNFVSIGVIDLSCELTIVIYGANTGRGNVDGAFDALDYTAAEVVQRVIRNTDLRIVRVLIGLDIGRAADGIDDAVVDQSVAVACRGACVLSIYLAVDYAADSRAIRFLFLIVIYTGKTVGAAVDLLPDVGVVPPVVAVIYRIALNIAIQRAGTGWPVDLRGGGLSDERRPRQRIDGAAVIDRILANGNSGVAYRTDGAVFAYIVSLRDSIGSAQVAVVYTGVTVNGTIVDRGDRAAVVP